MQGSNYLLIIAALYSICVCASFAYGKEDKVVMMGVYGERNCQIELCVREDDIRIYIYEQAGFTVETRTIPTQRRVKAIKSDLIDMMVTGNPNEVNDPAFIHSKYADTFRRAVVYYWRSDDWKPSYPPQPDFQNVRGVTKDFMVLVERSGLNLSQMNSYGTGKKMLESRRVDYWITASNLVYKELPEGLNSEVLYTYGDFVIFANTARGRRLEQVYTKGLEGMVKDEAKYREIYFEEFSPQNLPFYRDRLQTLFGEYRKNYPGLFQSEN